MSAEHGIDISGIDHFAINVRDYHRSVEWYERIFRFRILHKWDNAWMIGRGNTKIGLFLFPKADSLPDPDNYLVVTKIAFLVDGDKFSRVRDEIKAEGIDVSDVQDTGIAYRFQFNDPDGHRLEITTFHGDVPPRE